MRAINLSIPDTLERDSYGFKTVVTRSSWYTERPVWQSTQNLLAKMLDTSPSTIHKTIDPAAGVCESTGLFTLPETISYKPEQRPGMAL